MEYNYLPCDDLIEGILDYNNVTIQDLDIDYDMSIHSKVFYDFKDYLILNKTKRYLIVGDYDFDGIAATTIIKRLLNHLGISSNHYIPSRIKEGYGVNKRIVKVAIDNHFDTLILLDNGIIAQEEINYAKENGIDVLIIDHHEFKDLPKADVIIHDKLVEEKFANLSAAGLCYILSTLFYDDSLSLVLGACAILSDMMIVLGFNRYLLKKMIKLINLEPSMVFLNDGKPITYQDISFTIVPKINALSRMEDMANPNYLIRYFNDLLFQKDYIKTINQVNEKRKMETKLMSIEAQKLVDDSKILVLASRLFKEGLCGLIANRLLQKYNRPILVLNIENNMCKGSGRAPLGFNFHEALKDFGDYVAFGGHEAAVGLSIKYEDLASFKNYVDGIEVSLNDDIDVMLLDNEKLDYQIINRLEELAPFGTGLKLPPMAIENHNYKRFIVSNKYPKFSIDNKLSAISFNENLKYRDGKYFIGTLKADTYRKNCLSFLIEDIV